MTPRTQTRLKIWLTIVGVFVLGCVTGASLDSAYRLRASADEREGRRNGPRGKEKAFEEMKRDLSLNDQQATEIRAILDQTRNDYRALRTEVRPRYDALRQTARTRIRALLTPEQQQRFDAKVAERDARRKDDERDEH
jgi:Spy/CpxP family protein refolding chaperone